jgi:hypothetical protein
MYKGHWAKEVVCVVPDVIVVNFFCPTEPGRGKMIGRVGHDECDLAIRLIQHFFFVVVVVLPLYYG